MQSEESTKPYLYYEQIINGIVSIPKRIQSFISDAILVKNEQHRIELEKQKQALTTRLSIEDEDDKSGDKGLFKLPLFGWFSFGDKKDQSNDAGKTLEQEVSSNDAGKTLEQEVSSNDAGITLEQEVSSNDAGITLEQEVSSDDAGKSLEQEVSSDDAGKTLEQEVSSDDAGKTLEQEVSSDDTGKTLDQAPPTILAVKDVSPSHCNIRKWNY